MKAQAPARTSSGKVEVINRERKPVIEAGDVAHTLPGEIHQICSDLGARPVARYVVVRRGRRKPPLGLSTRLRGIHLQFLEPARRRARAGVVNTDK